MNERQSQSTGNPVSKRDRPDVDGAATARTLRIRRMADPKLSRSVEFGLAILECMSKDRPALGIADLADMVGISRSTTHRYATTLVVLGYLEQDPKRKYRLSSRAAEPGMSVIGALRLRVPARPILEELRDRTGHTTSMAVLDRTRALYVHRLFGHRAGQYAVDGDLGIGAPLPVHCTALGKALLASMPDEERSPLLESLSLTRRGPNAIVAKRKLAAELERISESGVAISDEELMAGLRSVAVPVAVPAGVPPMAIDVAYPSDACSVAELTSKIAPLLQRAARRISDATA